MKKRLILIKGPFAFVYANEFDKAPKYAISLAHIKANVKAGTGSSHLVTLETTLGDVEYEISFSTQGLASEFASVVKAQAAVGEAEEIRKVSQWRKKNQLPVKPNAQCSHFVFPFSVSVMKI